MKIILAFALLVPTAAIAAGPFDGTWKTQLDSIQFSSKPDVYKLDKGIYNRLVARGSMQRLVTEQQVMDAMTNPPSDTRAYFRGRCLAKWPEAIGASGSKARVCGCRDCRAETRS